MPLTSQPSLPPHLSPHSQRRRRCRARVRACIGALGVTVLAVSVLATATATATATSFPLSLIWATVPPAAVEGSFPAKAATTRTHPSVAARGCTDAHLMPTPQDMALVAQAISCLVNARRRAVGLAPLLPHPALHLSAEGHSLNMVARDFFSHRGPGGGPAQRMRAAGYACRSGCGENIAWGTGSYATASSIVGTWMSSSAHRANILRRGFRYEGIGAVLGAPARGWRHRRATTVTQDFAAGA